MWPAHSSYFGIVDMCGFKKDRFYLYQSKWTEEPMVHMLPHWNWKGREGQLTPVMVYTSAASAELFVNGVSHGKKVSQDGIYRLIWEEVEYEPGSIKTIVYDEGGSTVAEKVINTAGKPAKIVLSPDRTMLGPAGDLSFVSVTITDEDGNICPGAQNLVSFTIEGQGRIVAVGNGNPISHESYQAEKRKAFNGKCLAIVGTIGKAGKISLEASSSGLESDATILRIR